ncbi:MAG: NAD(P)H-hydrate dehydratase, partial [Acidimicrobiia bacterium]
PSGLDAAPGDASDVVAAADRTVTFHTLKLGHLLGSGPDVCGDVRVAGIGLVGGIPELMLCEDGDAPRPRRRRTVHKWSAGSVAVAGGSPGISGAPLLCARTALAFGAGAVRILCPTGLEDRYGAAPEVMTTGIGEGTSFSGADAAAVLKMAQRFDVLALGPGLGSGCEEFVAGVVTGRRGALIIDADGLNALDGTGLLADRTGDTIITPHTGEFTRLHGGPPSYQEAGQLANECGITVLLKGNPTFIAGHDQTWVVTSGGPELATIGTGDVLCGMAAALWARGLQPAVAARSAAHWHGVAGAAARRSGVTADRLVGAAAAIAGVA